VINQEIELSWHIRGVPIFEFEDKGFMADGNATTADSRKRPLLNA